MLLLVSWGDSVHDGVRIGPEEWWFDGSSCRLFARVRHECLVKVVRRYPRVVLLMSLF